MASNWSRHRIYSALRKRGTTAAAVAEKAGISRFTVYGGLEQPYPKVHDLICEALGKTRHEIWPKFYDENGERIGLISSGKAE